MYVPPNEQKVMELSYRKVIPSLFVHLAVHEPVFLEQAIKWLSIIPALLTISFLQFVHHYPRHLKHFSS